MMRNKPVDENNNNYRHLDASDNSCTKITSSDRKSSCSGSKEWNRLSNRKSASVTCLESSSCNNGNVTASTSNVNKQLVCTVVNCSAHFSSKVGLQYHYTNFRHSPCNPMLLNKNSSLSKTLLCYICPKCDREFQKQDECKKHMVAENHTPFYPPLAVTAYMCSLCLHMFSSFEECMTHAAEKSHHAVNYVFTDDQSLSQGGPVAVARELVEHFIRRCGNVPYTVYCLECGLHIESYAALEEHKQETNNHHTVASFAETSMIDVFAGYRATYVCNTCHRLFSGELKGLAEHQCAKKTMGTVVYNNMHSFSEFVKRCALTLIKSIDTDEGCLPGPSQCKPQTKKTHWMDTVDDTSSDNADIEIEIGYSKHAFDALQKNSENLIIYIDDSSDDTESVVNGGLKRKRKRISSDRNKQLAYSKVTAASRTSRDETNQPPSPSTAQQSPAASQFKNILSSSPPENIKSYSPPENIKLYSPPENIKSYSPPENSHPPPTQSQNQHQKVPSFGLTQNICSAELTSTGNMKRMKNIIFLDLDNWACFFRKLPKPLPDQTFVWGFFGGKNSWLEPNRSAVYRAMKDKRLFYLNEQCGSTKSATDIAIVLTVGKMDERLPSDVAFTILSSDKGFMEVERQMKNSTRKVLVVNPHTVVEFSNDKIYAMVTSITDSKSA